MENSGSWVGRRSRLPPQCQALQGGMAQGDGGGGARWGQPARGVRCSRVLAEGPGHVTSSVSLSFTVYKVGTVAPTLLRLMRWRGCPHRADAPGMVTIQWPWGACGRPGLSPPSPCPLGHPRPRPLPGSLSPSGSERQPRPPGPSLPGLRWGRHLRAGTTQGLRLGLAAGAPARKAASPRIPPARPSWHSLQFHWVGPGRDGSD